MNNFQFTCGRFRHASCSDNSKREFNRARSYTTNIAGAAPTATAARRLPHHMAKYCSATNTLSINNLVI